MALAPINPTQLTPPRVDLIDPRSGAISREWYRFFLSLLNATESNQSEVELAPDTSSLLTSYDAMLETLAQATESEPDASSFAVGVEKQLYEFQNTVLTEHRTEYVDTASAVASLQVLTWLGL
jgi:hypothetical protein